MPRHPQRTLAMLKREDVALLATIERLMSKFEYVPVEMLERRVRLPPSRILASLDRLNKLKLIKRRLGSVIGYTLTYYGLDVLATNSLVGRGVVSVIGEKIGVGKEGEVYIAETPAGDTVIVKYHREGRRSFSKIRRHREYALLVDRKQWLRLAKLVGEREFKVLVALEREGARVPKPIGWSRNAVVQSYIPGAELYKVRWLDDDVVERVFWDVVETLRIAYERVGVIHGDLSEYNILVSEDGRGYVIDWPQYVYRDEPVAAELLERDVRYLTAFFRRRFRFEADPAQVLEEVTGGGSG